ncbi:trypsin-like peptidase domain-containing protein [Motilibacter deserti]|uniref:PDZ domain-containing protein n=1 Tax=Motilibacter deserti TaxID=2714956 RepID=A0ABX0GRT1_9ACTN|nr:trypsin-like peptidase domain-containing protein [Motilibacter deserti]NHC13195.1 PDZ domain-containing protein [Motilibacter deserti]
MSDSRDQPEGAWWARAEPDPWPPAPENAEVLDSHQAEHDAQPGHAAQPDQGGGAPVEQGGYAGQPDPGGQGSYAGYGGHGGYAGQPGPSAPTETGAYAEQAGHDRQTGYADQGVYGEQVGYAQQPGYGQPQPEAEPAWPRPYSAGPDAPSSGDAGATEPVWPTPAGSHAPVAPAPHSWGEPAPGSGPDWGAGYGSPSPFAPPSHGAGPSYPGGMSALGPGIAVDQRRPEDTPFSTPFAPPYASGGWSGEHYPGYPAPQLGEQPRRRGRTGLLVTLALLGALVAGATGGVVGWRLSEWQDEATISGSTSLPSTARGSQERDPGSVPDIAAQLLERVVSIEVSGGSGSGFVIQQDGYVLTNNHVIASAASGGGGVRVAFEDGRTASARIVGRDSSYDLAVLKVDADDLPVARFGDSDSVVVGDPVIAVGSPLGLSGTVTTGIVSALNRPVTARGESGATSEESFYSAIQTDAAINPGNSGGPLVNAAGDVIGVNSAISSLSRGSTGQSGSIGLGFAIPSNQAKRIAEEIIRTGKATHPVIKVTLDRSSQLAGARIGLPSGDTSGQPAVTPGGPADLAGLREGDVITRADGRKILDADELIVAIRAKAPGDTIKLTYVRDGRSQEVTVTLGSAVAD